MTTIQNLKTQLKQAATTAEKYRLNVAIAELLERSNPKEALSFAKKAYELSKNEANKNKQVDALTLQADIIKNVSEYKKALALLKTAERIAKETKYVIGKALILAIRGFVISRQGKHKEGAEMCEKALKILVKKRHQKGIATVNRNLGAVYFGMGAFENCIKYSMTAYEIYLRLKDEKNSVIPLCNMANAYFSLDKFEQGLAMIEEGLPRANKVKNREIEANFYNLKGAYHFHTQEFDAAIINFKQAIEIWLDLGSFDYVRNSMSNLSSAFSNSGEPEKAVALNNEVLEYINKTENPQVITVIYSAVATTQTKSGDFKNALINHQNALEFAIKAGNKEHQRQATADISMTYELLKEFENALLYHKKFKALHDEIFKLESEKIIAEVVFKLKEQSKELKIKAQELKIKAQELILQKQQNALSVEKNKTVDLEAKVKGLEAKKRFETQNCGILNLDKIMYFKAAGQKTEIYLTGTIEPFIEKQTLGEIEKQLSESPFFRIHKSYLINAQYLARKDSRKYYLKNGLEIFNSNSKRYQPDLSDFLIKK